MKISILYQLHDSSIWISDSNCWVIYVPSKNHAYYHLIVSLRISIFSKKCFSNSAPILCVGRNWVMDGSRVTTHSVVLCRDSLFDAFLWSKSAFFTLFLKKPESFKCKTTWGAFSFSHSPYSLCSSFNNRHRWVDLERQEKSKKCS